MADNQITAVTARTDPKEAMTPPLGETLQTLSDSATGCHDRLHELHNAVEALQTSIDRLRGTQHSTSISLAKAAESLASQPEGPSITQPRAQPVASVPADD